MCSYVCRDVSITSPNLSLLEQELDHNFFCVVSYKAESRVALEIINNMFCHITVGLNKQSRYSYYFDVWTSCKLSFVIILTDSLPPKFPGNPLTKWVCFLIKIQKYGLTLTAIVSTSLGLSNIKSLVGKSVKCTLPLLTKCKVQCLAGCVN